MFGITYEPAFRLSVFLFTGPTNEDADFEAYLRALRSMGEVARTPGPVPCAITVVDPGNPIPNAHWRKKVAEASAEIRVPAYHALVTESAVVRGVSIAITWLLGSKQRYEHSAHATFASAVRWMEARRGVSLAGFQALLLKAREQAERGDRAVGVL